MKKMTNSENLALEATHYWNKNPFETKSKGWLFCKMECLPYDCMVGALFYEMLTLLLHFIK
jgi:hypothetical protein